MNKNTLSILSKSELIEIILSSREWERKAFGKTIDIVSKKINSIIDEQEKCDLTTFAGRIKYRELEEEYKTWSKIQDDL